MATFPDELVLYLPGPDEPSGVLPWGKSSEQTEEDLKNAVARFGGHRAPNYGQAYLLGANTLLTAARERRQLDHHGLPIFYLQRHAAELMIKAPLDLAREVQEFRDELGKPRPGFPSGGQEFRMNNWHGLQELLADLEAMVEAMQVGSVPTELRAAVAELVAIETRPTWSRYSFSREKKDGALVRHVKDELVLPLGRIQNLLQEADVRLGAIWNWNGSIMGSLGDLWQGLAREKGLIY